MEANKAGLEPAATVVRKLGGPSKVALELGIHRTRVSNWMRSKEAGGTGGRIPQNHHRPIIAMAQELGKDITAEGLLPTEASGEDDNAKQPAPAEQGAAA